MQGVQCELRQDVIIYIVAWSWNEDQHFTGQNVLTMENSLILIDCIN